MENLSVYQSQRLAEVGPIRPEEAMSLQHELIPDQVYETFNRFIGERIAHGRAIVYQDEVVSLLVEKGMDRAEIFDHHWLDVEDAYRSAGWKVEYDKPAYNETYRAHFIFQAR